MDDINLVQRQLADIGLSDVEADTYLALLRGGSLGAAAIAESIARPRSSVYAALRSLTDRGIVEGGAGYGSRFRPVAPDIALGLLMQQHRETLARQARTVDELVPQLKQLGLEDQQPWDEEVIEVLRSTKTIVERFDRLQLEAQEEIEVLVKAPTVTTKPGNPTEMTTLRRGVRNRGLYEKAALDLPGVTAWMGTWAGAGEEIRIYPGELPIKLVLADRRNVLMPLPMPSQANGVTAILIRHSALGQALHILFDHLWQQSRPFSEVGGPKRVRPSGRPGDGTAGDPAISRSRARVRDSKKRAKEGSKA